MLSENEKVAIRNLEEFGEDFIARLLVSDSLRSMNLDEAALRAVRILGPLIYIEGAGQVFKMYDCYFKP